MWKIKDFSHGKFVLTPKFADIGKNGDFYGVVLQAFPRQCPHPFHSVRYRRNGKQNQCDNDFRNDVSGIVAERIHNDADRWLIGCVNFLLFPTSRTIAHCLGLLKVTHQTASRWAFHIVNNWKCLEIIKIGCFLKWFDYNISRNSNAPDVRASLKVVLQMEQDKRPSL